MKKVCYLLLVVVTMFTMTACDDYETYAKLKEKEQNTIKAYIDKHHINVITESQFNANDSTTSVEKNEYVYFDKYGVYMQIVSKGSGSKIKNGENLTILCRFAEYSIEGDSLFLTNNVDTYSWQVDKMIVKNTSGTFTATFDTGSSLMYSAYGSASVPTGWLLPLTYINLGRSLSENDDVARVNIIVPHTMGQTNASSNTKAYFYSITYMRGL